MSEESSNSNQAESFDNLLEYEPPKLHKHGTVHDLTLTAPAGPNFDGGGGSNIYASDATPTS